MTSAGFGLLLALLSLSSQIGKGLQKEGGRGKQELSAATWREYVTDRTWLLGVALDVGGALFGLASLSILPISIAQPIFCNGLAVLALFSALYLKESIGTLEWVGIGCCMIGTTSLAATLVPASYAHVKLKALHRGLGRTVFLAALGVGALEAAANRAKRQGASERMAALELMTGTQAGLCVGVGNAVLDAGLQTLRAGSGKGHVFGHLISYLFVALGLGFTVSHPVFANRGYSVGRVVVITSYITLVSLVAGVLVGLLVLGEPWPTAPLAATMRLCGLVALAASVVLLNATDLRALLLGGGASYQGVSLGR
jgi:multidrug transporter EmrE-like cation transporter